MKIAGQYKRPTLDSASRLGNFHISTDMEIFPIDQIPSYLQEGVNGVCTEGSAVINVFSNKCKIVKGDLIVILPYQLASITEMSEDFSMLFFIMPKPLFFDIFNGICRLTPPFFFYMRNQFIFKLTEQEYERFAYFCQRLSSRLDSTFHKFCKESILHILRVFYWDIYIDYKANSERIIEETYSHQENLAFRFFCLIMEHHNESREVSFYANKLCISPKYLTMLIRNISGRSAKDWIVEYTILEIKALLRDTELEIKEVVSLTQFHSQSMMSRFFRKHTGMIPSQYRGKVMV